MIMMVLNKSKLKKIIMWVLVLVALLSSAIFFMKNKGTKPTFEHLIKQIFHILKVQKKIADTLH